MCCHLSTSSGVTRKVRCCLVGAMLPVFGYAVATLDALSIQGAGALAGVADALPVATIVACATHGARAQGDAQDAK